MQLDECVLGRRAVLRNGLLVLASGLSTSPKWVRADSAERLRFGLVTDLHYADKPRAGTRCYRETLRKLAEVGMQFEQKRPSFIVELGDLIDAADSVELEQSYLKTVNAEFASICRDRHYVLGNHCVDTLRKQEFLDGVGQEKSYYAFDRGGFHFVVLDSCFRSDGEPYGRRNFQWTDANMPGAEIEWLRSDLAKTDKQVIVFAHQRLDKTESHSVRNCAEVRKIFELAGNVLAVFQGHSHQNDLQEIGGIHYCTLVAMVEGSGDENNACALIDVEPDGTIQVAGFRKQKNYRWANA